MLIDDIAVEILPFLPRNDCEKLQLVCRQLNQLIGQNLSNLPLYRFKTIYFHGHDCYCIRNELRNVEDIRIINTDPEYYQKLGSLIKNAYFDEIHTSFRYSQASDMMTDKLCTAMQTLQQIGEFRRGKM